MRYRYYHSIELVGYGIGHGVGIAYRRAQRVRAYDRTVWTGPIVCPPVAASRRNRIVAPIARRRAIAILSILCTFFVRVPQASYT